MCIRDSTGAAGTSEWIHVNTQDALSTPVCVSPVGAIVEDTQGVTVVWRHEISTGTAQTAYELQTSSNMGGQYTTLSTAETDASSFATPAGQFAPVSYTHLRGVRDLPGRFCHHRTGYVRSGHLAIQLHHCRHPYDG